MTLERQRGGELVARLLDDSSFEAHDASRHLGLKPTIKCITPCFDLDVQDSCVVELTLFDCLGNVVWGSVDLVALRSYSELSQSCAAAGDGFGSTSLRATVIFKSKPPT